jgi:cyclopropane fatty-acyl-phospholipid synthase-like methyltransferase
MLATAMVNMLMMIPYIPSRKKVVERLLEVANLKKGEVIYDLGCGDGRILFEAKKKADIKAIGYEAAPIPYLLAKFKKFLTKSKVNIYMRNFFKVSLKEADVIFCYLGPDTMDRIAKKIKDECRKGTRIYSHTFQLPALKLKKNWPKDRYKSLPNIYYYEI